MKDIDIEKMWDIDHRATLGQPVTDAEREFFNENLEDMKIDMEENSRHWANFVDKL